MILKYKSSDCPTANGRVPKYGEAKWTISIPLEDGDSYLEIDIGRKGREALKRMLEQEEKDDADASDEYARTPPGDISDPRD